MIAVEQARTHLEQLGLLQAAAVLDARLEAAPTEPQSEPILNDLST